MQKSDSGQTTLIPMRHRKGITLECFFLIIKERILNPNRPVMSSLDTVSCSQDTLETHFGCLRLALGLVD